MNDWWWILLSQLIIYQQSLLDLFVIKYEVIHVYRITKSLNEFMNMAYLGSKYSIIEPSNVNKTLLAKGKSETWTRD